MSNVICKLLNLCLKANFLSRSGANSRMLDVTSSLWVLPHPSDTIFDLDNHGVLLKLISEMASSGGHFLLMGDFNYVFVQWPSVPIVDRLSNHASEFAECLDDNFLVQHVTSPTRTKAILDQIPYHSRL